MYSANTVIGLRKRPLNHTRTVISSLGCQEKIKDETETSDLYKLRARHLCPNTTRTYHLQCYSVMAYRATNRVARLLHYLLVWSFSNSKTLYKCLHVSISISLYIPAPMTVANPGSIAYCGNILFCPVALIP